MKTVAKYFCLSAAFFALFFVFNVFEANAASLYFSPSSGNFTVGNILNTSVLVNAQGQAINNSSVVINFPTGLLEVISVSKSGSIFSLWVEEPAFSNSAGIITFDGGLPTPGYNGSAGRLLNITFRIRNAGTASLIFSSAAVRANDGYGTDILQTRGQAQFNLVSEEQSAVTPPPALGTPQAPAISSPTHPDSNKWYALKDAKFVWSVPRGATAIRILASKVSRGTPAVVYTPALSEKEITNLTDGIWYFHAQFRNASGWGEIAHFRFQVDSQKPSSFDIAEVLRTDRTEPKAQFTFDAKDETSGIDYYEIQIDNEKAAIWRDDGGHKYQTPAMSPGAHTLIAKAVDGAGNALASSSEFTVDALNPPVITEYPQELQSGEHLVVRGATYPDATLTIWLQKEKDAPKSFSVKSSGDGKFIFTADEKPTDGIYKLWAEVVDERGARSLPTDKLTIVVSKPAVLRAGTWAANILAVVVPLVALIVLLLLIILRGWYQFMFMRKRLRKEVREAETALHNAFDALKENMREHIKLLEKAQTKRQLTKNEERLVQQLKDDLDEAEEFVKQELEDIEKEVK